jgi:hypothetical protein
MADLLASVSDRLSRPTMMFGGAVALVSFMFVVSVQREIGIWQQAADLRNRVLAEARTVRGNAGCSEATFSKVPDSVDGAYVFRNGFPEAIGGSALQPTTVPPECSFTWAGDGFAPSR